MKHLKIFEDFCNEASTEIDSQDGTLKIEKREDGKYYWQFKFKSGKKEDWPNGFDNKADAQKDFMYRSKYLKEYLNVSLDEATKEIDYSNAKDKILVGLKTNLLKDMKDRYDYKEDGDKILFFDKKGHHFGTLFDVGTRYQQLQHDGSLDDKGWLSESLDEATTSWSTMMRDVRKSESGPWSLVAIEDKKVVGQHNDIRIKDMLPAHFEALRKEHPRAKIHIEDGTGMVVWNETK